MMKNISLLFIVALFLAVLPVSAKTDKTGAEKKPNVESSETPEKKGGEHVLRKAKTAPLQDAAEDVEAQSFSITAEPSALQSLGANLIQNPSLESTDTSGNPSGWFKGGYGSNTRSFAYPVVGAQGTTKAIQVTVSNYAGGDAKWFFQDVPVSAGKTYVFSNYYKSTLTSTLTARYKKSDGSYLYPTLASLPASSAYTQSSVTFTVPAGVTAMTVFHLIQGNGTLTTDEYTLREVQETPTDPSNLVQNPGFESTGINGLPTNWSRGGWGTNDRSFPYPVTGVGGGKAAQVKITSYSNGDAKWYTPLIPVERGVYTYSDAYSANVTTYIAVEYRYSNGTSKYVDIASVPSAGSFTSTQTSFYVPAGVTSVRVFHMLKSTGTLTIDNVSLVSDGQPSGIFEDGAVTLTFDDGWLNQYQNAVPKLKSAGYKATFFIISQQFSDDGYTGFMSKAQVKELYNSGFEIGGHTRTHRALTSLSSTEQQNEISGSKQDLFSMGISPVNAFAYPFGDYNQITIDITQGAGYTSARSTLDGSVDPLTHRYQLPRQSLENDTTLSEVQSWVNNAIANKTWLILTFHQVGSGTDRYSISPAFFNQIIDYLKANNVPIVTIEQGVQSMQ